MIARRALAASATATMVAAVATAVLAVNLTTRADDVDAAQRLRAASIAAADELRQSSDDLTRLARLHVVTGDDRYAEWFDEVLAIRNGEQPRPVGYDRIYWDFRFADPDVVRPVGQAQSLLSRFEMLGFSANEISRLRVAEDRSNALAEREARAFAAVIAGEREQAIELVFGDDYLDAKAGIMEAIDGFLRFADERTTVTTDELDAAQTGLVVAAAVTALLAAVTLGLHLWRPRP